MKPFIHQFLPSRVVFGPGTLAQLAGELNRLGVKRALLLSTAEQRTTAEDIAGALGDVAVGVFAQAMMHVPLETVRRAQQETEGLKADGLVAIGGGSTVGLAKALALDTGLPIVAVPTTYAGSEVTPIYGLTEGSVKRTGRDPRVLPRTVIYDAELSAGLPMEMTVTSLFNAMAHAAEAIYAHDGSPMVTLMAEQGLRASAMALLTLRTAPGDLDARGDALYGAYLCGSVLGMVSMGLHHKLCHTLGGGFNLPHAALHTVILPHALAYNAAHAPQAMASIARALGVTDAARGLHDLALRCGAPVSLQAIGMPADGLDQAVERAMQQQYPNPRPLEASALRALLHQAFEGLAPVG